MEEPLYRVLYEVEDRHWWFRGRRAIVRALLARAGVAGRPRILDAGCGTGRNLQDYAGIGPAEGIEPSPEAVEFCRRRGLEGVQRASLEQLPFEEGRFGLLLATDVLEHVADDRLALRELRRVAAAGAVLVLTVPAYQWLWSGEDERLGHRRRYTRPELRATVEACGWRTAIGTYFNTVLLPPIALARRIRGGRGAERRAEMTVTPRALDPILAAPMKFEAALIRRGLPLPAGVSVGMVCRAGNQ